MTILRPNILLIEDDPVYARFAEASLAKGDAW